jgi:hypothetical protein
VTESAPAEDTRTLPSELRARLANMGPRSRVEVIQDLIVALCSFRPWSAAELGQLLGSRDPRNLAKLHLRPLTERSCHHGSAGRALVGLLGAITCRSPAIARRVPTAGTSVGPGLGARRLRLERPINPGFNSLLTRSRSTSSRPHSRRHR